MEEASTHPTGSITETIGLPARPRQPDEPAPSIDGYRFVKVIGRGAFGTVWLAEEPLAGVYRAIKVLKPRRVPRPTASPSSSDAASPPPRPPEAPFQRELDGIHAFQTLAKDHPHLVRILKTGVCKGAVEQTASQTATARTAVYYVMEIADHAGGAQPHYAMLYQPQTLASLIKQHGRLPPAEVVRLAIAMLDAIEHLHKAGLQHRDVKPSNVLFVSGVLKLADLGLTASDGETEIVGTPGYLPPAPVAAVRKGSDAALTGTPRFGPPDDLYALGKVMYELTTGLPVKSFPDWPEDLDPKSDPLLSPLRELINTLCHPSVGPRPTSARDVRRRLELLTARARWIRLTRRGAALLAAGVAFVGLVAGFLCGKAWYQPPHPMDEIFGVVPYDGSEPDSSPKYVWKGATYMLLRSHRPGPSPLPCSGTSVTFWDLQTRLVAGRLEVAGGFQIYQEHSPVSRDITNPRGIICQVCLCIGDELRFLYSGQPGAAPGACHSFGCRDKTAIPLDRIPFKGEERVPVYLFACAKYSQHDVEEDFKTPRGREAMLAQRIKIAEVGRASNDASQQLERDAEAPPS